MKNSENSDPLELEFPLTVGERRRLAAAPFAASSSDWTAFALSIAPKVVEGYRRGDVTFERAVDVVHDCALGCSTPQRILVVGMTAEQLRVTKPKDRNARKPQYPQWLRQAAVDLLLLIKLENPQLAIAGAAAERTIQWLVALRLTPARNSLSPSTLGRWYQERMRALGASRPQGRPRR